jgi:adenine C2-methylase RlmN of 23S rRNA A2503 and tRNA A37
MQGELYPIDGEDRSKIVLIEYIMLRGINDTEEDAHRYSVGINSGSYPDWLVMKNM